MPVWGDDHCCGHCYFQLIWLLRKIKITQSCGEVQLCPSYWSFVAPIKAKLQLTTLAKSHFLLTCEDFKLRYNANLCIESITVEAFLSFKFWHWQKCNLIILLKFLENWHKIWNCSEICNLTFFNFYNSPNSKSATNQPVKVADRERKWK